MQTPILSCMHLPNFFPGGSELAARVVIRFELDLNDNGQKRSILSVPCMHYLRDFSIVHAQCFLFIYISSNVHVPHVQYEAICYPLQSTVD